MRYSPAPKPRAAARPGVRRVARAPPSRGARWALSADRAPRPGHRWRSRDTCAARVESLPLPRIPQRFRRELQSLLVAACDEGDPGHEAARGAIALLKLSDRPLEGQPECRAHLRGREGLQAHRRRRPTSVGGTVPSSTSPSRCARAAIRSRSSSSPTTSSSACRRRRGPEARTPRFVRFDLNEPAHGNESRGLRCHLHPGHDDLIVAPAPLMHPVELLDLFPERSPRPARRHARRA